jgi:hypothetical protein
VNALNAALSGVRTATEKVTAIWESLGKPEAAGSPLVTWEPSKYAGHRGFAGGIELFTVAWHTRREEPTYSMRTDLPGQGGEDKSDDLEELKAIAERRLAAWLTRVTGSAS